MACEQELTSAEDLAACSCTRSTRLGMQSRLLEHFHCQRRLVNVRGSDCHLLRWREEVAGQHPDAKLKFTSSQAVQRSAISLAVS